MKDIAYALLILENQSLEELTYLLVKTGKYDQSFEKAIIAAAEVIVLNNQCEKTARLLKAFTQLPPSK